MGKIYLNGIDYTAPSSSSSGSSGQLALPLDLKYPNSSSLTTNADLNSSVTIHDTLDSERYIRINPYYTEVAMQEGYRLITNSPSGSTNDELFLYLIGEQAIRTKSDAKVSLGASNHRFKLLYLINGVAQTSDRNEKNTIIEIPTDKAKKFILGLNPVTYKMNEGSSGRTHWGLISQDIEELMETLDMTSLDFAGFIKSPKTIQVEVIDEERKAEEGDNYIPQYVDQVVEGEYDYSLRYDEFISPMIKVIQSQEEEINSLRKDISDLTDKVNRLEQLLETQ